MIYDTITKGDDGLYHVHAFTDEHKRCFIRLDNVVITDATDDITFDVNASTAIDEIHEGNIQNAIENGESWFGKKVSEKTIRSAYIRDEALTAECIEQTKIFGSDKELLDKDALVVDSKCSVILEFHGMWFAKKAFGPAWNVVQVKIENPESVPVQETFDKTYPEEYMFGDDQ
jgi:hypothetical protein